MRQIPSSAICNFFYVFYVIYAVLFVLSVLSTISVFMTAKKLDGATIAVGVQGLVMTGIGATMTLFYYLICDRALIGKAVEEVENFRSRAGFRNPQKQM